MARSAIPDFGVEYPAYEYKPFPKYVGADELGEAIIANNEKEYEALKGTEYFPRVMGKDKAGKDVIAQIPRDLEWLKGQVVTPPEDPAVVAKREADAKAAEAEVKRKAAAYDALMAGQRAGNSMPADTSTGQNAANPQAALGSNNAQNALTAPTGLKKSKAA